MGTGICYVFGGGERTDCTITFEKEDLVIAADAGFDYLNDLGLRADVVLGDFDSVISYDLPSDSLRYPKEKDDTDMMLALKLGLERGYTEFRIYVIRRPSGSHSCKSSGTDLPVQARCPGYPLGRKLRHPGCNRRHYFFF